MPKAKKAKPEPADTWSIPEYVRYVKYRKGRLPKLYGIEEAAGFMMAGHKICQVSGFHTITRPLDPTVTKEEAIANSFSDEERAATDWFVVAPDTNRPRNPETTI